MTTNAHFSFGNIRDAFLPLLRNRIMAMKENYEVEADIVINHINDSLQLLLSCDGKVSSSLLIDRYEIENTSIGQLIDLIHDRIENAITTILPQPNNVFAVEYEEIMLAQDLINKIQT